MDAKSVGGQTAGTSETQLFPSIANVAGYIVAGLGGVVVGYIVGFIIAIGKGWVPFIC